MGDITIGQTSGLIAAGVFTVQLCVMLALPILLAAYVAERNSVVTWSVLGRFLHGSFWPSILRADSAASTGVPRRVTYVGIFQTVILILITVVSIVTPLGLYDTITPNDSTQLESFKYLPDPSAFGRGTPPRSSAQFTRNCGLNFACPGGNKKEECVQLFEGGAEVCNSSVFDRTIPEELTALFRDGASSFGAPVSSVFDIQWRTHLNASDPHSTLGYYLRSAYRQITTLILEPGLHVVDGLIIDSESGGVGFRNHTVPANTYHYGSTWTEDLLFVEPETQCVNLNFTFNFHLEEQSNATRPVTRGVFLKDHGGFSNLSRTNPVSTMSTPPRSYYTEQGDLHLRDRAYNVAWLNNFLTLTYFNLTNPDMTNIKRIDVTPGMEIHGDNSTVANDTSSFYLEYQSIRTSSDFGEYLVFNVSGSDNPFNVTKTDFNDIAAQCVWTGPNNFANLNTSVVACGMFYGAARRTDGGDRLIPDPGSQWEVPVYSCASSIKATIRTVDFVYNGTTFDALNATSARPKRYAGPSEWPLWGVEDMGDFGIVDAQPLWGVLGPSNTTIGDMKSLKTNISTVSRESIQLPGAVNDISYLIRGIHPVSDKVGQNLPGVDFYTQALSNAFNIGRPSKIAYGDYSGQTQLALFAKWQELSRTADRVSKIVNLVWTDIAANSVVGTKGWGLASAVAGGSADQDSTVPIVSYRKRVRFYIPYAVPGFVVLPITLVVLVASIVMLVMRRTGIQKLRELLNATSSGRIISLYEWPEEARGLTTGDWVEKMGGRPVVVSTESIIAGEDKANEDEQRHAEMPSSNEKSRSATM